MGRAAQSVTGRKQGERKWPEIMPICPGHVSSEGRTPWREDRAEMLTDRKGERMDRERSGQQQPVSFEDMSSLPLTNTIK